MELRGFLIAGTCFVLAVVACVAIVRSRPRLFFLVSAAALPVTAAAAILSVKLLLVGDTEVSGLDLLSATPMIASGLCFLVANCADMQSSARANLYSADGPVPSRAHEVPTRLETSLVHIPEPSWGLQRVAGGMPEMAHSQRRPVTLMLMISSIVILFLWTRLLITDSGVLSWVLLDGLSAIPLAIVALGRRTRLAGERPDLGETYSVQVVDPLRPEFLRVDIDKGIAIRRERKATWVAVRHPRDVGRWIVVALRGKRGSHDVILTDWQWRMVIWLGVRPWLVGMGAHATDEAGSRV